MTTIVEFIEARLNEDEQIARTAASVDGESWAAEGPFGDQDLDRVSGTGQGDVGYDMAQTAPPHIARHDPARVLRQCKALRSVVRLTAYTGDPVYEKDLMEDMAAIWSDHPDYRERWSAQQED